MATRSMASILSTATRSLGAGTFARSTPACCAICTASRPCISRSRRNVWPIEARAVSRERLPGSRIPTGSCTVVLLELAGAHGQRLGAAGSACTCSRKDTRPTNPAEGCSNDTNKARRFRVEAATRSTGSNDVTGCSFCRVPDSPGGRPVIGMDILFFIATVFLFVALVDFVVCIVSLARHYEGSDPDLDDRRTSTHSETTP